jgi:methionyl aminopeptidase
MSEYDEAAIEKFKVSGRILREAREEIKAFVREGMKIIEVCEKAEELVRSKGGKPAFPCNVSINEVAAHYTSPPGDEKLIPEGSVVKVDLGAHVDGYVTDTAVTVCFNREYDDMVETAQRALKAGLENVKPGVSASKIGTIIENTVKSRGFKPISNLTGHQVGRYLVHTGTSIPNVSQLSLTRLKLGNVYAIEPFVTLPEAAGRVEDGEEATIFRYVKSRSLKNSFAKQLARYIEENFHTLPFTERWLQTVVPEANYKDAFRELLSSKVVTYYPVFVEASRRTVAQAEHTVMLVEDGCLVLT